MPGNANINPFGGNKIVISFLNALYALVTTVLAAYTNCADLGEIESSAIPGALSETEKKNEKGQTTYASSSRTIKSTAVLQERHKALIDFLAFTVKANPTCLEYKYLGIVGGKHQEMFSVVNVQANVDLAFEGGNNSYTATRIVLQTAVVFTSGDLTNIETGSSAAIYCTAATIPPGQEFVIVETAVV